MRAGLICSEPSATSRFVVRGSLLLRREGADFGLALRVGELAQLGADAAGDRGALVAGLETGEVWAVLPREGTAESFARLDRRVMDDVDGTFVVRIALLVAGEIAEITARGEDGGDAGNGGDRLGVLERFEGFEHHDDDEIVVDGLAIAAGNIAPHFG